jgi:hypothetical protein
VEHAFIVNFRQELANAMWEDRQQYYSNTSWVMYLFICMSLYIFCFYEPMYPFICMRLCMFCFYEPMYSFICMSLCNFCFYEPMYFFYEPMYLLFHLMMKSDLLCTIYVAEI